ncbi:transposase family protein, partial [Actinomadura sp. 7K534]|uniref:transposase family protein n=1 Tax=Actinomadura sp. 7K534 TaxID=2530366 RepID=UPI0010465CFE
MLFYRAAVDLSRPTLNYVAGIVRRHRRAIGSRWRLLDPGQQALLVLVHLRKGETFAEAAAGFGVSVATAWRYVERIVSLLSARSPKLWAALRKAGTDGLTHLVLDGTLIHTDRVKADRPYFSGKHRVHGMNVQVIAGPDGTILWTSGAMPGKIHDLTAARVRGILRELEKAGILTLADKTSHAVSVSSRGEGAGCERGGLLVGLLGVQAVVQAAEQA